MSIIISVVYAGYSVSMLPSTGAGLLNSAINKLPVELHLPGYRYCGPGTHLRKRLQRGDPGINPLDEACKEHDIAYSTHKDLAHRHRADLLLQDKAWKRAKSSGASLGERASALLVTGAMGAKRKLGMGCKTRRRRRGGSLPILPLLPLLSLARQVGQALFKKRQGSGLMDSGAGIKSYITSALKIARNIVKRVGGKRAVKIPRVLPLPKTGGFLPFLIPLFAGLSAAGGLAGGGAAIAKAVNDAKSKARLLEEAQRHNKTMEAIALGKRGSGLYLKNYRRGYGLYLRQPKN